MSTRLVVPVAFCNPGAYESDLNSSCSNSMAHAACSKAQPTSLVFWGFSNFERENAEGISVRSDRPHWGAAMGCADGTVYLFHPGPGDKSAKRRSFRFNDFALNPSDVTSTSVPQLPSRRSQPHSSRSTSPSSVKSNLAPMAVSKSRVVSALSKEQVEAPKNFVDFEDEQEKLKSMLTDRGVKDRTIVDGLKPHLDREFAIDNSPKSHQSKPSTSVTGSTSRKRDDTRSLLSSANSPTIPPSSSISSPPSPIYLSSGSDRVVSGRQTLSLKAHIFPKQFGVDHAVTDIKLVEDGGFLLCLQESGLLSLFALQDGACIASGSAEHPVGPPNSKQRTPSPVLWTWKWLHVARSGENQIIMVTASQNMATITAEEGGLDRARVCIFELKGADEQKFEEVNIEKVADIVINGFAAGVGLFKDDAGKLCLFYTMASCSLVIQPLRFLSAIPYLSEPPVPEINANTSGPLSLPNPFKALKSRPERNCPPFKINNVASRVELSDAEDLGQIPLSGVLQGMKYSEFSDTLVGVLWSEQEASIFSYEHSTLKTLCRQAFDNLRNFTWLDRQSYTVVFEDRVETYILQNVDANNDRIDAQSDKLSSLVQPELTLLSPLKGSQVACVTAGQYVFSTRVNPKGFRRLELCRLEKPSNSQKLAPRSLWSALATASTQGPTQLHISSILPLDIDSFILGYSDGSIRRVNLRSLTQSNALSSPADSPSQENIGVIITGLHLVQNKRTKEQIVVGGGDDGSVAFWDLNSLQLRARWVVFTSPLAHVIHLREDNVGRLRDCTLCISEDGTIAVVAIDGFEFLTLIPGSVTSLRRICLGEDNLLLFYLDGRARLWDVKTWEFWRAMDTEKAEGLLEQGGWFEASIGDGDLRFIPSGLAAFPTPFYALDSGSSVLFDIVSVVGNINHNISEKRVESDLHHIQSLLSVLLTPGLDDNIDNIVRDRLKVPSSEATIGYSNTQLASTWLYTATVSEAWQLSADVSAARLLSIVALLRGFFNFGEYEVPASTVVAFYTTSLPDIIGPNYQPPSLHFLAHLWSESSVADIRQAARMLFEAEVARLSDNEIISLIEKWQHRLPCVQPDAEKQSSATALALFLTANVATERYSLLSASTLTDIAKSITIYLYDENSLHRSLAIDLCSRGFQIWQTYFDAMEALRALISLATSSRKDSISLRNPGPPARLAILQIASSNTPLFMTTLSLDILHPRSVEYSKSIMQMVAFLIRKKPLVLFPNLPRLIEAVVKSLDPSSSTGREAVLDAATEILGQVVRTFPTIDFHMATQRLAVGTSEGAVIMYDLKTATRLYVLEGHRKRLAAISFSPDGRRLVTVSLEESVVLVWKVGSSLSSFFYPGAPPRQGHGGSSPFKTLSFNVGDEADMTVAATLEWVTFEWSAERSVKLKIRDSTLTFST